MATCPECEFDEIDTEDFEVDDIVSCPECGKKLVMVGPDDDDEEDDEEDEKDKDE
jgi:DNA-directed RNA polymerase subunit RPC12/RpoP